ncbi:hypothetical protein SDC9_178473 [bioreactor metagenome]|uniref:Uncharacterized protein n=1 Tax=bioreactor metagenome TaxID=1076179 RepID=A0A645GY79_9ZZZZ
MPRSILPVKAIVDREKTAGKVAGFTTTNLRIALNRMEMGQKGTGTADAQQTVNECEHLPGSRCNERQRTLAGSCLGKPGGKLAARL